MDVNVTALIENRSANPELAFEFGLSLLVEAGGRRILFDAAAPAPLRITPPDWG